jgi:hypothetical protein
MHHKFLLISPHPMHARSTTNSCSRHQPRLVMWPETKSAKSKRTTPIIYSWAAMAIVLGLNHCGQRRAFQIRVPAYLPIVPRFGARG